MAINSTFWKGKTVLITGHTGFKGSWLSLWLQQLGAAVIGVSLDPPSTPSLFELTPLKKTLAGHYIQDIRHLDQLQKVVEQWRPELIFHLAAQPLVRQSYRDPHTTFSTNILGTLHLLELIRSASVPSTKVFINITTDKCYAPRKNPNNTSHLTENSPLGGVDPYSSSKTSSELITQSYYKAFWSNSANLGVATLRTGNVLGGGDWGQERLIPDFFRFIEQKSLLQIRRPDSIRPWQHVLDALHGYLLLAQKLWEHPKRYSGPYNIAPPETHHQTVKWVIEKLGSHFGPDTFYEILDEPQPAEVPALRLSGQRANKKLGLISVWNLEKTLEQTAYWMKAYLAGVPAHTICLQQIDQYVRDFHESSSLRNSS